MAKFLSTLFAFIVLLSSFVAEGVVGYYIWEITMILEDDAISRITERNRTLLEKLQTQALWLPLILLLLVFTVFQFLLMNRLAKGDKDHG